MQSLCDEGVVGDVGVQGHVDDVVVEGDAGDAGGLAEQVGGVGGAVGDGDVQHLADGGFADGGFDGAGEDQFAAFDDADFVTEVGKLREDVGADEDRFAHLFELFEELADFDAGAGVEAAGGFVEQENLGSCRRTRARRKPLLHAFGECVDHGVALVGEVRKVQHIVDDLFAFGAVDVVGGGEEFEVFLHDHVFVGAEGIGHVADERADFPDLIPDDVVADAGLAPGGLEKRGEDFDGGGFARAVGADEAEAVAILNGRG